jgi:hypothetical protein
MLPQLAMELSRCSSPLTLELLTLLEQVGLLLRPASVDLKCRDHLEDLCRERRRRLRTALEVFALCRLVHGLSDKLL